MGVYHIEKGHNLPLAGSAELKLEELPQAQTVSVNFTDYPSRKFRLFVKAGDTVKAGQGLCSCKAEEDLVFTTPVAGTVKEINRGARRALLNIVIEVSDSNDVVEYPTWDADKIKSSDREALAKALRESGMWQLVRQRPYSTVADPQALPKSIFINAMNTGPNNADQEFLVQGREAEFAAGLSAISKFTDGQVHLVTQPNSTVKAFTEAEGVNHHTFEGVHPAGLTGTHIGLIDPINKGDVVWFAKADQVALMGEFLLTGKVPSHQVIAITGAQAPINAYAKVLRGAQISDLVDIDFDKLRVVSGDVLSGVAMGPTEGLGIYENQVSVLPECKEQFYLGEDRHWTGAGVNRYSTFRLFLSKIIDKDAWDLDTSLNGEERGIVLPDVYDRFSPLDIPFNFLVKACLAEDIDSMEKLGLLELDPEDVALATFACPSKTEVSEIIRRGLAILEKEG